MSAPSPESTAVAPESSPAKPADGALTDSPWFWAGLFSTMALAALTLIGPKFAVRQSRLNFQQEVRQQVWQQRVSGSSIPGTSTASSSTTASSPISKGATAPAAGVAAPSAHPADPNDGTPPVDPRGQSARPLGTVPLFALLAAVAGVSWWQLWRSRRPLPKSEPTA